MKRAIKKLFAARVGQRAAAVIAIAALGLLFISSERSAEYETEPVSVGSVISTITSVGSLRHFEETEIHSAIAGAVTDVLKSVGDEVAQGDVLIRLDATAIEARYEKARAELEAKEADFKYQSELYEKQLNSANDYNSSKIAMEQAKAEFSEALKTLEATEIKSPISGTVIFRSVEVGRSVDNKGGVLMKVAGSSDRMTLLVRVSEADIGRVAEGQQAHFTVSAFKDRAFAGEIVSVPASPIDEPGVVVYEVSAFVENPELLLKSGMTADVTVKITQVDDVLRVPTAALRFIPPDGASAHARASAVWVKTVTGIKHVPVTTGESNDLYAEVKNGQISEGDRVVVGIVSGGAGEGSDSIALPQPKRF